VSLGGGPEFKLCSISDIKNAENPCYYKKIGITKKKCNFNNQKIDVENCTFSTFSRFFSVLKLPYFSQFVFQKVNCNGFSAVINGSNSAFHA